MRKTQMKDMGWVLTELKDVVVAVQSLSHVQIFYMQLFNHKKKNEIMPFAATWMDLDMIILSEVTQRQVAYDSTYM